jgi:hypothetical protein
MARDDWRLRAELEAERHATDFLARLGLDLGSEAKQLAKELQSRRLAVSNDHDTVFVYGAARDDVERARTILEAELQRLDLHAREVAVERWIDEDDRWSGEADTGDVEEEALAHGYAPWEVRVECDSRSAAHDLAEQLEGEGYGVVRRFRYVFAGTATEEEARVLAARVHGDVEPGGELVYEVTPDNPFAIFGGLGG